MATREALADAYERMAASLRTTHTEEQRTVLLRDWAQHFAGFPDAVVQAASMTLCTALEFFPTTGDFLVELQTEARLQVRQAAERTRREPEHREPLANAHVAARAIRTALALHMPPAANYSEMEARAAMDLDGLVLAQEVEAFTRVRGGDDTRGHDHRKGAAECPVCSRHDHSSKDWRQNCPACGVPDEPVEYQWSTCRGCDGGGFVFTAANTVRPCEHCKPEQFDRWREGHMDPGHTCEECHPTRRQRRTAR